MNVAESITTAATVSLGVGGLAKQWEAFPDRFIPTLVAVVGAITVCLLSTWTPENFIAGLVAGLGSTGANQIYRQYKKDQ